MDAERWQRIRSLFERTAEMDAAAREREFAQEQDSSIVEEVRRMLMRHESGTMRLDRPPVAAPPGLNLAFQSFFPGETIGGRFRIVRLLGRGGMGEVYEAEDGELNERVALKAIRPGLSLDADALARFRRETQLARRVTHPNVCRIFDLFTHSITPEITLPFLSMELVEGETLSERLKRDGPMKPDDAMPLVEQMAAALESAHAVSVVHRDFKSSNILLGKNADGSTRVVVTDFGLARSIEAAAGSSMDASRAGMGTPAYMAPEQIEGGKVTAAADVYAFGVVLYQLITGRLPFEAGTPMAMAVRKLRDKPVAPSRLTEGIPAIWDAVIERCLEYRPEDRFQSPRDVLAALGGRVRIRPLRRDRGRRLWWIAAAAAIIPSGLWIFANRPTAPRTSEAARLLAQTESALAQRSYSRAASLGREALKADPDYFLSHARLGQALVESDQIDTGRDSLIRASTLASARWFLPAAERDELEGIQKAALRDSLGAAISFRKALGRSSGERANRLRLDLASALEESGTAAEAIREYESVLASEPRQAAALLRLGRLIARTGKFDDGVARMREAERLFEVERNLDMVLESRLEIASAMRFRRRLSESRKVLEELESQAAARGQIEQRVKAMSQLASVAALEGRNEDAKRWSARAREIADAQRLDGLWLSGIHDLAFSQLAHYDFREAEITARQAMTAAHEQKRWITENAAKMTLASALIRQHRADEGVEFARQGLAFYESRAYRRLKLAGHALLLDAAIDNLDTGSALAADYLRDARALGDPQILARALGIAGHFAIQSGDWPRNFEIQSEMRDLYRRLGRIPQVVSSYYNEAELRARMGETEKVGELFALGRAESAPLGRPDADRLESKRQEIEARFANYQGRHEKALLLRTENDGSLVRDTALVMLGRGREAWTRLERCGSGHEMKTECSRLMALTLLMEGRLAQARFLIEEAHATLPESAGRVTRLELQLVRWAILAKAKSPDAKPALATASEMFAAMSATWTDVQRARFRARLQNRGLWPE